MAAGATAARFVAIVVFPTPRFWFRTAIVSIAQMYIGTSGQINRAGHGGNACGKFRKENVRTVASYSCTDVHLPAMRCTCIGLLGCLAFLGGSASAQAPDEVALPRAMRLEYVGPERCPDASFFRERVMLKRPSHADPFVVDASARLVVTLSHDAAGYRGRWEAIDAAGAVLRRHDLGPVTNCHDLADGLAFGFVLRFDDPNAAPAPLPNPSPSPVPISPPSPVPVEHPLPPAPPPAGHVLLGLSGLLGLATTPAPAGGAVLGLGWRAPWWSISAEGRALITLNAPVDGGHHVSLHRVTGAVLPCLHWRWLFGCGVLELGELGGSSDADVPASDSAFIATLGGRGGVEIPLGARFAFRAAVDGFGTVKPAIVRIGGQPRWETPAGGALVGAGFLAFF